MLDCHSHQSSSKTRYCLCVHRACAGGPDPDLYCVSWAEGPLCYVCRDGYYSSSSKCYSCGDPWKAPSVITVLVLLSFGAVLGAASLVERRYKIDVKILNPNGVATLLEGKASVARDTTRSVIRASRRATGRASATIASSTEEQRQLAMSSLRSTLKVVVIFIQILTNFTTALNVHFPSNFTDAIQALSVFSLDVTEVRNTLCGAQE